MMNVGRLRLHGSIVDGHRMLMGLLLIERIVVVRCQFNVGRFKGQTNIVDHLSLIDRIPIRFRRLHERVCVCLCQETSKTYLEQVLGDRWRVLRRSQRG